MLLGVGEHLGDRDGPARLAGQGGDAGILDAACREMIVERALALGEGEIELENLKVIVLMVLWQQDRPINGLILDELLNEAEEPGEDIEAIVLH